MIALGVQPGQVVCILGFNRPEWIIMDMAAMLVGAVPAGIYWTSSVPEVEYILNHSQSPVLLIENDERYQKIAAIRPSLAHLKHVVRMKDAQPSNHDTMAWDEFCAKAMPVCKRGWKSGCRPFDPKTTAPTSIPRAPPALPKAVELTHANLSWSAQSLCGALGATADQRVISYLPLAHVAEQMISVYSPACKASRSISRASWKS